MWNDPDAIDLLWLRYYKGATPVEGDDAYQRWLRETVKALFARRGSSHPIASDDERQWVDRAVMDGVLAWSPGQYAVMLGTAWAEVLQRDRTPYEIWIESVHAIAAREPYPIAGDQEREWADKAVAAKILEWDLEGVTLRQPRTGDDGAGPYR